jgi:hypothetical protein
MQKQNTEDKKQTPSSKGGTPKKQTSYIKSPIKTPKKITTRPNTQPNFNEPFADNSVKSNQNKPESGYQKISKILDNNSVAFSNISKPETNNITGTDKINKFLAPRSAINSKLFDFGESEAISQGVQKKVMAIRNNDLIHEVDNTEDFTDIKGKKKKDWKSWCLNEKLLFYEAIANGDNYSSLQKLFKNMNDVIFCLTV